MRREDDQSEKVLCPQPLINSLHRASVWSTFLCALVDDYVACYLPVGCRRYNLVRSFTTLTKLLPCSLQMFTMVFDLNVDSHRQRYFSDHK